MSVESGISSQTFTVLLPLEGVKFFLGELSNAVITPIGKAGELIYLLITTHSDDNSSGTIH